MAFTYDAVGNRLTGPAYPKASSYLQNYVYDYENRIVSVTRQVTGNPNADTVTFKYDPFGRRIEKNVSTYENGLPTAYKYTYVYDNEDIILEVLERTQSGNTTTTTTAYTHGPGIDEPLSLARNGQKYYYHADGLGSITSMTDSTQAVVNRYSYDSFGVVKRAETVCNDFTYTGREYDYETGLYYYRARYYDPEAGRFVNKDPIGFEGGDVNVFNYVRGNPVNWADPLGLFWGIPMGENYGEAAAQYYANITVDPCASNLEKAGAWAGGILSSLWTSETSSATFFSLTGTYGLRNAGAIWNLRDGSPARTVIDYGNLFRLEQHMIGKGAARGIKWHIDALWGVIRHWPWNY
jgi:RHS repeat-associated protein